MLVSAIIHQLYGGFMTVYTHLCSIWGWFAIALRRFLLTHVGNNNNNVIFWIWLIQ